AGDGGSLPVIIFMVAIVVFFTLKVNVFFTAVNFDNLLPQMTQVTVMAIGVVFVLLIGEIDLSIGYLSGLCSVVLAELQLPGSGHHYAWWIAILGALGVGAFIGAVQGSFVAFLGVPSFVVTLAGLLAWQGVLFKALPQSVITIQNSTINDVAGYYFSHTAGWIIAAIASAVYAIMTLGGVVGRFRAGIATRNLTLVVLKVVGV